MDGYRLLAQAQDGRVALRTRNGADASAWFPEIVRALSTLNGGPHAIDGEVCVLDDLGRSDFNRLHARASIRGWRAGVDSVVYCPFDLLLENGVNLCAMPLVYRKTRLQALLAAGPPSTLLVQSVDDQGEWLYQQAVSLKL